jgi:hypothetical protein
LGLLYLSVLNDVHAKSERSRSDSEVKTIDEIEYFMTAITFDRPLLYRFWNKM